MINSSLWLFSLHFLYTSGILLHVGSTVLQVFILQCVIFYLFKTLKQFSNSLNNIFAISLGSNVMGVVNLPK